MREAETTAPVAAKPAATNIGATVVSPSNIWNSRATIAAPDVCPRSRAVASMPLAEPLRCCGAEAIMILLLGDWNNPNPAPHNTNRQTTSAADGCDDMVPSATSPAVMTASPVKPSTPACMRSTRRPASGATP